MKIIPLVVGMVLIPFFSFSQIVNFDKNGRQLVKFDVLGEAVDAHDGEIAQFDGVYYLYGTSYDCGYEWGNKAAPFCGFKVYASKDLKSWEDKGFLFDATTPVWQTRCDGKTYGCYRPHVIYNAKTGLYVLWINVYDNRVGYRVFTSKTPVGPFKEVAEPTLAVNTDMPVAGLNNGDHDTFIDDDGVAYLAYTNWRAKGAIVIEQLSENYLTGTGKHIPAATSGNTEAPCLFKRKGIYYLVYSDPNCGYCSGTGSSYKTASSPLGPWSDPVSISNNSCGGQPSFVSVVKVNSEMIYLYGSDLWNNAAKNEALANYYWAPLTFTEAGAINQLNCTGNYKFAKAGKVITDTATVTGFSSRDDINKDRQYAQSFKISRAGKLGKIELTIFKNHYPDAGLSIALYNAGPDDLPAGAPVFQQELTPASIGWAPRTITVKPGFPVKKGGRYVIVLKTTATTGNYGFALGNTNLAPDQKIAVGTPGDVFKILPEGSIKFKTFID